MMGNETKEYMEIYINRIIAQLRPTATNEQPLFTSYDGKKIELGRLYTAFMNKYLGVNFGTTSSRSMLETDAYDAFQSGLITQGQRDACTKINGHTSAMALKYYQR